MSFLEREIARLAAAIVDPANIARRAELYAAQQALAWTTEPSGYASPFDMIMRDTREEPEGCPVEHRPLPFLDTRGPPHSLQ